MDTYVPIPNTDPDVFQMSGEELKRTASGRSALSKRAKREIIRRRKNRAMKRELKGRS